jgi:hypothetical protein
MLALDTSKISLPTCSDRLETHVPHGCRPSATTDDYLPSDQRTSRVLLSRTVSPVSLLFSRHRIVFSIWNSADATHVDRHAITAHLQFQSRFAVLVVVVAHLLGQVLRLVRPTNDTGQQVGPHRPHTRVLLRLDLHETGQLHQMNISSEITSHVRHVDGDLFLLLFLLLLFVLGEQLVFAVLQRDAFSVRRASRQRRLSLLDQRRHRPAVDVAVEPRHRRRSNRSDLRRRRPPASDSALEPTKGRASQPAVVMRFTGFNRIFVQWIRSIDVI